MNEPAITLDLNLPRPWITLPSGFRVQLDVRHLKDIAHPKFKKKVRCTAVFVIAGGINNAPYCLTSGHAYCDPRDNFCKLVGRKKAAARAIKCKMLGKADRKAIFEYVCPEFSGTNITKLSALEQVRMQVQWLIGRLAAVEAQYSNWVGLP